MSESPRATNKKMSQVWYLKVRGSLKPSSFALEKVTALKGSRAPNTQCSSLAFFWFDFEYVTSRFGRIPAFGLACVETGDCRKGWAGRARQ